MFLCVVVLFVYTRVVDLYPWDAGIKSGLTYNDPGDDTMPKVILFFPSLLHHNFSGEVEVVNNTVFIQEISVVLKCLSFGQLHLLGSTKISDDHWLR